MALTQLFADYAQATLAGAITNSSLTANLSPGSGAEFPSPGANQYFTMTLNDAATGLIYEKVWVTARTGDVITMLRGQEGSTATNWLAGDIAFNGWTAASAAGMAQVGPTQAGQLTYAVDTGTANAYQVAYTPAVTTLVDGMALWFTPTHANTGPSSLNVNGLGIENIYGNAYAALQGGEIIAGGRCLVVWNAALPGFVLVQCAGGALQVAVASESQHALQLEQAVGRLINIQTFTSSGTYTPAAGAKNALVRCLGGGGAGGGTSGTGASQAASGGGGASGGYAESWITNPGIETVTIGAGGTGAVGASGNGGGTSSFGSLVVVMGGQGGALGPASSVFPGFGAGGGVPGSVSVGGNIISSIGAEGGYATLLSSSSVAGAAGANSPFGGGGLHTANNTGNAAGGKGAGGSSASAYASQGALAGGNGSAGLVIIEEYA